MRNVLSWFGGLCICLIPGLAQAAAPESRLFEIRIDGRPAGECRLTYSIGEDGAETLSGTAAVRVKQLLSTYQYRYEGSEVWKGKVLQHLHASIDDDGKKINTQATPEATGLRVTVNGRSSVVKAEVWPMSYWRLQSPGVKSQTITLLDVDTGRTHLVKLELLGVSRIPAAGQVVPASHYRTMGPVQADLWYDSHGRLMRQSSVEDGHRMILELKELPH
jgi:hypothetical protein